MDATELAKRLMDGSAKLVEQIGNRGIGALDYIVRLDPPKTGGERMAEELFPADGDFIRMSWGGDSHSYRVRDTHDASVVVNNLRVFTAAAIDKAVADEREECAKLVESNNWVSDELLVALPVLASRIRERGKDQHNG